MYRDEILKNHIPRPGESGGAPYGQLYGSPRLTYENLLQRMGEAVQVGDVDHLIGDGDLMQGPLPKEAQ